MKRKNIKLFTIFIAVSVFIGGLFIYCSQPSLEKMVGQMIITGFHGDGMGENAEEFAAISDQIKRGQIGGVILFDVDVSGLLAKGMTIQEAKKQIFSSNIKNMAQVKQLNTQLQSIAPTTNKEIKQNAICRIKTCVFKKIRYNRMALNLQRA